MLTFFSQLIKSPIGRHLTLSIVLFSSVITLITTAYQLISDYRNDVVRIDRVFSNMEKVNLDVLAASIWVIDERLINTQLNGLIQLPDINYISIKDDSGQAWNAGEQKQEHSLDKTFPLVYKSPTENINVGTLEIQVDVDAIYQRLYDKAIIILLSNGIKTFLVAGFILFLVWFNITKHLDKLSQYCKNIDIDHEYEPLQFVRHEKIDEFKQVADSINSMQVQLRSSFSALKNSKTELQIALEDRERLLKLERSYKEELARQVKERTLELEQSLSALKRAQQVLVEQEKMAALGGLVSGVAHEINTPIGICLTAASAQLSHIEELIDLIHSDQATLDEINEILNEYQESCELIVRNITKASSLIQKFKTIAIDRSHEEHQCCNLNQQLHEILESTLIMHPNVNASTEINVEPTLNIKTNISLLNQIVSNILSNAFTHAFQGHEDNLIHISATLDEESIQISIQNNGLAIPADVAEHMFEPFFTTNRNKGGTGLGLSAAFNAATLLKGTMSYRADSKLGGPQFDIKFPYTQYEPVNNQQDFYI
ncbi:MULTISPECIES: ATP-binding protein [unclassified Shewanella]|uniref:ATP-binding protein n=1 Tax=unclassified Shewanella TaxID=196818 RepID=UPI001B6861A9|nr:MULTISPECIES: ATP-binding protein [unclassified Shewanella]MBP6517672.1 histidine kinase [Shewanella sp.]MCU8004149.1 ATP-binding protein [Shewanella sp. SM96]MCU8062568.1 ATP-binding protein [Shewanella sp. SM55]